VVRVTGRAPQKNLQLRGISKRFAAEAVLDDVTLELHPGTHVCVMGRSGAGKSTLLRILAGLEQADRGELWLGDERIDRLPAERRPTRTVFQRPALFPHESVAENVAFVARLRREPASRWRPRVDEMLERFGLPTSLGDRRVHELSGGEAQRVALARALFEPPAWLLLDEPLTGLDHPRRASLRRELASLHDTHPDLGIVHVTHEAEDALLLADELVTLERGRVLAQGEPHALYRHPPDFDTASLLGELTKLPTKPGQPAAWLRPERLRVVPAAGGRCDAQLLRQARAGQHWELVFAPEHAPLVAYTADAWQGPNACGLDWDDADTLTF
jgi:ABC-type Fe3+/spermidine/putrescine transport system ATPase subunit